MCGLIALKTVYTVYQVLHLTNIKLAKQKYMHHEAKDQTYTEFQSLTKLIVMFLFMHSLYCLAPNYQNKHENHVTPQTHPQNLYRTQLVWCSFPSCNARL